MQKIRQNFRALLEKKPKTLKIGHLSPFDPGLFFHKSHLVNTMTLSSSVIMQKKNWEVPYSRFREKTKNLKNRHFMPYNPGYFLSKKKCSSNDMPDCPLQSCKKLRRSLDSFCRKSKEVKDTPLLDTSSPTI